MNPMMIMMLVTILMAYGLPKMMASIGIFQSFFSTISFFLKKNKLNEKKKI